MDKEFGEFEEITEENKEGDNENPEAPARVHLPRRGEFLGIVAQRLGGNRMEIKTTDGKIRNCRVPGRFKRRFWLRPGDIVLITPWPDDDSKGDIIYQYSKNAIFQLKKKGILDSLTQGF